MIFWSDDINADEILSPKDIMKEAGEELESRTGKLIVSIQESQLDDRVVLAFEVSNRESKTKFNLFEASHRLSLAYPVVIVPPTRDIPEFLQKKRYVPGTPGPASLVSTMAVLGAAMQGTSGRYVENNWVCATPTDFANKLAQMFAEDYVKSIVISVLASNTIREVQTGQTGNTNDAESYEETPEGE